MVWVYSAETHHLKRCNVGGAFNYLRLQFFSSLLRLRGAKGMDWGENLEVLFHSWRLEFFFLHKKKRGNHNPFFLRKQTKGHWCKTSPNNSIGGSARHWLSPPWRHISFPGLCFSYLGEFFPPKQSMNSCLVENGGWILHGASYLLDLLEPRGVSDRPCPETTVPFRK